MASTERFEAAGLARSVTLFAERKTGKNAHAHFGISSNRYSYSE
jgi:hypothetical protein